MAIKLGNIHFSAKGKFTLWLKTQHMVIADPVEGPMEVVTCVFWLWFGISYPAAPKHLEEAKKFWAENDKIRGMMLDYAKKHGYEAPKTH